MLCKSDAYSFVCASTYIPPCSIACYAMVQLSRLGRPPVPLYGVSDVINPMLKPTVLVRLCQTPSPPGLLPTLDQDLVLPESRILTWMSDLVSHLTRIREKNLVSEKISRILDNRLGRDQETLVIFKNQFRNVFYSFQTSKIA